MKKLILKASVSLLICLAAGLAPAQGVERPYLPLPSIDPATPQFARFIAWVDSALAGSRPYGFSAADAVTAYRGTGARRYLDFAVQLIEQRVSEEEALIAAGERPRIAFDSYLYVGETIFDLALTFDSAFEQLSASQRGRWSAYAEQTVWNIWHHQEARWGGKAFPWSGWSISNPGNNYHYSFLLATMAWGFAGPRSEWIDFLRTNKVPPLIEYFRRLPGGGSREGTGYGVSHDRLFHLYQLWRDAAGEELAGRSAHVRESIDYWLHATLPDLSHYAPFGDQARVSNPLIFDYHRALVIKAVSLTGSSVEAQRGRWWLKNVDLKRMAHGFNFNDDLPAWDGETQSPVALHYHAAGTGHFFARTSWSRTATWMSFVAGPYVESHDHQHQGAFSLFKEGWLAVTENILSHSGIHQEPEVHNIIRFVGPAGTIRQSYGSESSLTWSAGGGAIRLEADLSPAYSRAASQVRNWRRTVNFSGPKVMVRDTFDTAAGVAAVWQINVPVRPERQGDVFQAGQLTIKPLVPPAAALQIEVIDWKAASTDEYPGGGFKLELRGDAKEYQVELTVTDSESLDSTVPGRPLNLRAR